MQVPKPVRKKKVKKKKPATIKYLKKKAWIVFSTWIRERDNYTCVTCGKKIEDKSAAHAGHYIFRKASELFFSEVNVNCQCISCNSWKSGNLQQYTLYLQRKHGNDITHRLEEMRETYHKWTREELQNIYDKYAEEK